jgi:selenocysteine lyase/cysteine desulfurase
MNLDRFPAVMSAAAHGRILADNAGGTQLPDLALERIQRFLAYDNAQRGSVFARELAANELVEQAKREFAALLAVPPQRIGVGANATTLALAFSRLLVSTIDKGNRIVVTAADHEANVAPWMWLRRFGAQIDVVPVTAGGELDETKYEAYLERAPRLVALPWASNVTGTVFDVARLARTAKRAGAVVVVDGVQALPHFPLDVDEAIDFAFFSGYKIYAPHVGFWYMSESAFERFVRADDNHVPGEARYWTIETGTQSHEGLAGWLGTLAYFSDVAGSARHAVGAFARYEAELSNYARRKFSERAPELVLYGAPTNEERLPVFTFNLASLPTEELAFRFERANIEGRVGDFYAPRLLQALAPEAGRRAVRLSFAHYNTIDEIDRCFDVIDAALGRKQTANTPSFSL